MVSLFVYFFPYFDVRWPETIIGMFSESSRCICNFGLGNGYCDFKPTLLVVRFGDLTSELFGTQSISSMNKIFTLIDH